MHLRTAAEVATQRGMKIIIKLEQLYLPALSYAMSRKHLFAWFSDTSNLAESGAFDISITKHRTLIAVALNINRIDIAAHRNIKLRLLEFIVNLPTF